MIHHLVLFKLKPEVTNGTLEMMMRETRSRLLKISSALTVKCGKAIDPTGEWGFFLSVDVESMEKLALYREDGLHLKFVEEIIRPNTCGRLVVDFEMDPGKNIRFS
jgi:hypothetical protein